MATATAQDDDILIIADDSVIDDNDDNIEFSFDFGEDTPKKEEAKIEELAENKEDPQEVSLTEEVSSLEIAPEMIIEDTLDTAPEMVIEDSKMETE
jgi:hypothetical protein